jgi:hypothetical protein
MTQTPEMARLVERAKIQDALEYGKAVLVRDGERSRKTDVVWFLLCEAAETHLATPDKERKWLYHSCVSGMPEYVHTKEELAEAFGTMVQRVQAGEEPKDTGPRRPNPSQQARDRYLTCMSFLRYVSGKGMRAKKRNRQILFALACGVSGPDIARRMGLRSRNSAYAVRDRCLEEIAHKIYQIAFSSPQGVDGLGKNVQRMEHV